MAKMNIYIVSKYPTFIRPVASKLAEEGNTVLVTKQFHPFCVKDADVIYCDWMDENALKAQEMVADGKMILKCHAYEAYSGIRKHIKWDKWDELIFVNRHIKNVVNPDMEAHIIPNGIPVNDLTFIEKDSKKIAFLGYISRKKGAGLIDFLAKSLPEYEFHIGGKFQEYDVGEYIQKKSSPNIFLHGWIKDKSKFFSDKKYVINASMRESQCLGVMEGMACGCKPLIRDWIGASAMYKPEWTYKSFEGLKNLLNGKYEPRKYREFVKANYGFDRIYKQFKEVLL